jgi:tetratricopeptide (TPR) repeat protein
VLTKITLAIVLIAVTVPCLAQDSAKVDKFTYPPLPKEIQNADALLANGDSTHGLAVLRSYIANKGDDEMKAIAQYKIGLFYSKDKEKHYKGDRSEKRNYYRIRATAFQELMKVYTNYPLSTAAPWALYDGYNQAGDANALQIIVDNYKEFPQYESALTSLAGSYSYSGHLEEARNTWQKVFEKYPNDRRQCASALIEIALCTTGPTQVDAFKKVIRDYPDQANSAVDAYIGIASYYTENGDLRKAIEYKLVAIAKYPTIGGASGLENIMYDYQKLGDADKVKEIRERIIREYPNSEQAKYYGSNK